MELYEQTGKPGLVKVGLGNLYEMKQVSPVIAPELGVLARAIYYARRQKSLIVYLVTGRDEPPELSIATARLPAVASNSGARIGEIDAEITGLEPTTLSFENTKMYYEREALAGAVKAINSFLPQDSSE